MIKGKLLGLIIGASIVVIMVGLLAGGVWNPEWNPFQKAPSLIIEKAISRLAKMKTFKIDGEVKAEVEAQQEGESALIVAQASFSELFDNTQPENPKVSLDISFDLGMEKIKVGISGELIAVGGELYFKITEFPALLFLPLDFEEIKDQWYRIEREKFFQQEIPEQQKLFQELKNLIQEKEFFEIKKNFGWEDLEGVKVQHYLAQLKKDELKVLIPQIFQLLKDYVPEREKQEFERNLEKFLKDFPQNFEKVWAKIAPLEFEFWIEKNFNLRRLKFEKEIDFSEFFKEEESSQSFPFKIETIKLSFDFRYSQFNEKFEIEPPKNYKPFEEFFSPEIFLQEPLLEGVE